MQAIDAVYLGFFGVMIFSSALWLLVFAANRDSVFSVPEPTRFPSITFLVPAYNEEKYIEETLDALLALDYPDEKLDIIAINDGSTDSTLEKMEQYRDRITIIDKENGGKAQSMNVALEQVDTELVACMDADSFPEPDFLQKTVGYLEQDGVRGVTPAMKVDEPETLAQKVIWAEYVFQIFLRKVFAMFDVQYVMPGPGSLYETEYLRELGGWDETTLTEDMEVAFRMMEDGAVLENSAVAYVDTHSPETWKGLFRQRVRWYRGYIQNFVDYIHVFGNPRHGNLGVFFLPFNTLWLFLTVFFTLHFLYNLGTMLASTVETYLLLGDLPLSFGLSIQQINLFHIFSAYFFLIGIGTMLISLAVAGENVKPWTRKTHYIMFLLAYPVLFAAFWIAAIIEHLGLGGDTW